MPEIKPCPNPKCQSKDAYIVDSCYDAGWQVRCIDCLLLGPVNPTAAGAITAWNNLPRKEDCE